MKPISQILGKTLYAIAFIIVIPVGLWLWAEYTRELITWPVIQYRVAGIILMITGVLLMMWAMAVLYRFGKGLPMNLYPPAEFVTRGPYRLCRHPIYTGFGMLLAGFFIYTGKASGFWMVLPLTLLAMAALVLGYENPDLKERFPGKKLKPFLSLPENVAGRPGFSDYFSSLVRIIPLVLLANFIALRGNKNPGNMLPDNGSIPDLSIIFLIVVPFFLKRKDLLREWSISIMLSLFYHVFTGFVFSSYGNMQYSALYPFLYSVPLFLIFISLRALYRQHSLVVAGIFTLIAVVLMLFQLNYIRPVSLYIADALLVFFLSAYYLEIWKFLRESSERIANSWKEWVFGRVRVINHGFYVGFGAFAGVLLAGILSGNDYAVAIMVFTFTVTLCSALWAQIIEGSAKLKRPFGYYGGLAGILFGAMAVRIMGYNVWVIIGVASVVMPWIQAIGRLRCLVNGCCHGKKTDNELLGIRYFHPRSRVCHISGLKGEWIHPTQLYSILWLFFTGIFLLALWNMGLSCPLIFGLYLILTGLGRFVEEAYRGEVQTPGIMGLHLYQWTAIISILAGIIMTMIQIPSPSLTPVFGWESVFAAGISGAFIFFAMGVDFPFSNVRFSRLV